MDNSGPGWLLRLAVAAALLVPGARATEAATIYVRAGDDLQHALNVAQPGDTLLLEGGATFTGNFILPVKSGTGVITVQTADSGVLPREGARISPAHAPLLAKVRSGNTMAALRTAPGTHHWRIVLLEFPSTRDGYGDIIQLGDGSSAQKEHAQVPYDIELDRLYIHGDPVMGQKRGIALNARSVTIRNCYISDIRAVGMDTQAIAGWNGPGPFVIENNYLEAAGENFMLGGADPSIPDLVSERITFRHNYLSRPMAWREPVLSKPGGLTAAPHPGGALSAGVHTYRVVARRRVSGGATAVSTASDEVAAEAVAGGAITVTWTPVPHAAEYYVYGRWPNGTAQYWVVTQPGFTDGGTPGRAGTAPTKSGSTWTVKNIFELKNARHVLVERNVFENNWAGSQAGYAILFTPRNQDGTCTWCVVEDVTFRYNVLRNSSGGINILGYDDISPSQQTNGIRIVNNLFVNITRQLGGNGWFLLMGNGPRDITIDHNTIDADGTAVLYVYGGPSSGIIPVTGFQFTNNAARHGDYGINGAEVSFGNAIISAFFPGGIVTGNWLQGGSASRYPAGNYVDGTFAAAYRDLTAGDYAAASPGPLAGRGTDGRDIGADVTAVGPLLRNVETGSMKKPVSAPSNLRVISR